MEISVIARHYPGQSEEVRVGLGRTCLILRKDGTSQAISLTWNDRAWEKEMDLLEIPVVGIEEFAKLSGKSWEWYR